MHQQAQMEAQDRTQIATTKAIASAFSSEVAPAFASLLYQSFAPETNQPTGKPFPYDVRFLDADDLYNIQRLTTDHHHEAWPQDRLEAYQGKHILPKRAAVTGFLWDRYSENPAMTLETLKLWHDVEVLDQLLQVPPAFRVQHVGADVETLWRAKLGPQYVEYAARHQAVMAELMKS